MYGFIILLTGSGLLAAGLLLLRQKAPRKSYLFRQQSRRLPSLSLDYEPLVIGCCQTQLRDELKAALEDFRQENPSTHIRLVQEPLHHMVRRLEQGHIHLICSFAEDMEAMESRPRPINAALSGRDSARFLKENCFSNPALTGMLYVLWHPQKISSTAKEVINYLNFNTVTLHTGYCSYRS
ncbi:MAG: hypothetical protein Q4B85_00040 [Lachnospiraceae bacterium]|nr:hypothetical protein [Lachnospiraceae bacterium]